MHIFSTITRDHALFTIIISAIISLISGFIVTKINGRKEEDLHNFYLKQEFYINFVAYQIILKHNEHNAPEQVSEEFIREFKKLNAEMLIKGDTELIRDVIKIKKIAQTVSTKEEMLPHVTRIINKFRKRMRNKPISTHEFKEFIELAYYADLYKTKNGHE